MNYSWNNKRKYDDFMGKWSRKVAERFLYWLKEDFRIEHKSWLDFGCGTGVLTYEIHNNYSPTLIVGIDPSREYLPTESESKNITFKVGIYENLNLETTFDIIVSGLVLNFVPNIDKCMAELLKFLRPDGIIALYVWDYSDKMEMLRYFWNAAIQENPRSSKYDEGIIFPICNPQRLQNLFSKFKLREISLQDIIIKTEFENFEQYWNSFYTGQGPSGQYFLKLEEESRKKFKELLINALPISNDGSLPLIARAYAIRGKK